MNTTRPFYVNANLFTEFHHNNHTKPNQTDPLNMKKTQYHTSLSTNHNTSLHETAPHQTAPHHTKHNQCNPHNMNTTPSNTWPDLDILKRFTLKYGEYGSVLS
jgi:hypothetical protein